MYSCVRFDAILAFSVRLTPGWLQSAVCYERLDITGAGKIGVIPIIRALPEGSYVRAVQ